jgi:hypothetical protein
MTIPIYAAASLFATKHGFRYSLKSTLYMPFTGGGGGAGKTNGGDGGSGGSSDLLTGGAGGAGGARSGSGTGRKNIANI